MPKADHYCNIAQLILSLATTPDRAATTLGDLLEEADARGSLWFWSSVVRTACSLLWRDFRTAPLGMLRLALWGVVSALLVPLSGWLFLFVILGIPLPSNLLAVALEITASLWVGWEVAERSNGREVPAAFMVASVMAAFFRSAGWIGALFVMIAAILFRFASTSRRPSPHVDPQPADPKTVRHP